MMNAACPDCTRLSAEIRDLRAYVDALSGSLARAFAITGHPLPEAVGQNAVARPGLTLHQGGAA